MKLIRRGRSDAEGLRMSYFSDLYLDFQWERLQQTRRHNRQIWGDDGDEWGK